MELVQTTQAVHMGVVQLGPAGHTAQVVLAGRTAQAGHTAQVGRTVDILAGRGLW